MGRKTVVGVGGNRRSEGPLTAQQARAARAEASALSYDPVQIGWVRADCRDDMDMMFKPAKGPRYAKLSSAEGTYALRPWRTEDLDHFHRMLDDAAVWANMPEPYPAPLTRAHATALIELSMVSNHHEVRAVLHKGAPIGQLRLHFGVGDDEGSAELSYWLGQQHWGRGHGSAMVQLYVARAFIDHPGLSRLTARVRPGNTASLRVLEKAGFTEVARGEDWTWYAKDRR